MKTRIFFQVIILFLVTLTAGCRSSQTKLTASDNGKTIDVKAGDQIVVELDGNPSTGFNWEARDLDAAILEQVGDPKFQSSNPGMIGSGGIITMTFKALKAGSTILTLIYHRSWETDVAPASTYTVRVDVK